MTLFAPRSIVGDQWQPSSRVRSHRVADRSDDCKRVRLAQILDLFGEDSWRRVYAGELEVRPPRPDTEESGLGSAVNVGALLR